MLFALASVLLATMTAAPLNVAGRWEGKLTAQKQDGTKHEDTALIILEQKDTTLTGTVGGNDDDRHPITSGSITGNKIVLTAQPGDREMKFELTVEDDEMKGTITRGEQQAQLQLKKQKK